MVNKCVDSHADLAPNSLIAISCCLLIDNRHEEFLFIKKCHFQSANYGLQ